MIGIPMPLKYLPIFFLMLNFLPINALAEYGDEMNQFTTDDMSQMSPDQMQAYMDAQYQADEARRQIEQAEHEAEEAQRMQELKESNPEAYAVYAEQRQRQDTINLIITAHREQSIGDDDARYQLAQLITDDISNEIVSYEAEIAELTQRIIKKQNYIDNPQELLLERVDQMLGLAQPEQDEFLPPF